MASSERVSGINVQHLVLALAVAALSCAPQEAAAQGPGTYLVASLMKDMKAIEGNVTLGQTRQAARDDGWHLFTDDMKDLVWADFDTCATHFTGQFAFSTGHPCGGVSSSIHRPPEVDRDDPYQFTNNRCTWFHTQETGGRYIGFEYVLQQNFSHSLTFQAQAMTNHCPGSVAWDVHLTSALHTDDSSQPFVEENLDCGSDSGTRGVYRTFDQTLDAGRPQGSGIKIVFDKREDGNRYDGTYVEIFVFASCNDVCKSPYCVAEFERSCTHGVAPPYVLDECAADPVALEDSTWLKQCVPAASVPDTSIVVQDGIGFSGILHKPHPVDVDSATVTTYAVGGLFYGGVYSSGAIFLVPTYQAPIVKINASTGDMEDYGRWPDQGAIDFRSAVADAGFVWLIPSNSRTIVRVDPNNGDMKKYDGWPDNFNVGTANKFCGGVSDGQSMWIVPRSAPMVVRFYYETGSMVRYDAWPDTIPKFQQDKFCGAILAKGGVWMVPLSVALVRLDMATGLMTAYDGWPRNSDLKVPVAGLQAFEGGAFDGTHLWLVPFQSTRLVSVDAATGRMKLHPQGIAFKSNALTFGTWDGRRLWMSPSNEGSLMACNATTCVTATDVTKNLGGTTRFRGAVFDGRAVWLVPHRAGHVVRIGCDLSVPGACPPLEEPETFSKIFGECAASQATPPPGSMLRPSPVRVTDVVPIAGSLDANELGTGDGQGTDARFNGGHGSCVVDPASGNVIVFQYNTHMLRSVDPESRNVTTVVGNKDDGATADGIGTATARINTPLAGALVDGGLSMVVVSHEVSCLRKVVLLTMEVSTFAGLCGATGDDDGAGKSARFKKPHGITVDPANDDMYVTELTGARILRVTADGVAGPFFGDGSQGTSPKSCENPSSIAFRGSTRTIYFGQQGPHFYRYTASANGAANLVGSGSRGDVDGVGTEAQIHTPSSLVLNPRDDNVLYAFEQTSKVRLINIELAWLYSVVQSSRPSWAAGTATTAGVFSLHGGCIDPSGQRLYVFGRHAVAVVNFATQTATVDEEPPEDRTHTETALATASRGLSTSSSLTVTKDRQQTPTPVIDDEPATTPPPSTPAPDTTRTRSATTRVPPPPPTEATITRRVQPEEEPRTATVLPPVTDAPIRDDFEPAVEPEVKTAVVTAGGAATVAASAVVMPRAASQPARLMASVRLATCGSGVDPPERLSHPFMPIAPFVTPSSDSDDSYNAALLACAALTSALGVAVLSWPAAWLAVSGSGANAAAGWHKHAGAAMGVMLAYLLPSVAEAVAGVVVSGEQLPLACAALVIVLLPVAAAIVGIRRWHAEGSADDSDEGVSQTKANPDQETARARCMQAFAGGTRFDPGNHHHERAVMVSDEVDARHGAVRASAAAVRWNFMVDVGVASLIGGLAGAQPETMFACRVVALSAVMLALLFLAYCAALRPLADAWEANFTTATAVGQLALATASLLALTDVVDRDAARNAVDLIAMLLSVFFFVEAIVLAIHAVIVAQRQNRGQGPGGSQDDPSVLLGGGANMANHVNNSERPLLAHVPEVAGGRRQQSSEATPNPEERAPQPRANPLHRSGGNL